MKYDYSKVSREALEELAFAVCMDQGGPHGEKSIRECTIRVLAQAQVKTRAECDREIATMVKDTHSFISTGDRLVSIVFSIADGEKVKDLIKASRNASEDV